VGRLLRRRLALRSWACAFSGGGLREIIDSRSVVRGAQTRVGRGSLGATENSWRNARRRLARSSALSVRSRLTSHNESWPGSSITNDTTQRTTGSVLSSYGLQCARRWDKLLDLGGVDVLWQSVLAGVVCTTAPKACRRGWTGLVTHGYKTRSTKKTLGPEDEMKGQPHTIQAPFPTVRNIRSDRSAVDGKSVSSTLGQSRRRHVPN